MSQQHFPRPSPSSLPRPTPLFSPRATHITSLLLPPLPVVYWVNSNLGSSGSTSCARQYFLGMVDYEAVELVKDGERIKWPRVIGAAWEKAAKIAETRGAWGLTSDDLGGSVTFHGVHRRGVVDVQLKAADSALAVKVNAEIHALLHKLSLARVGPPDQHLQGRNGQFVRDEAGRPLTHDLVVQQVGATGLWSVEVKCVSRTHYSGLCKARVAHHARALKLWQRVPDLQSPDLWKGRLLVIVWVRDDRASFCVKVDAYPRNQAEWFGLHGWSGGTPSAGLEPSPAAGSARQPEEPQPSPPAGVATRPRGQKRPWDEVSKDLFPDASVGSGRRAVFAFQPRAQVCRATEAFAAANLPKTHVGQDLKCWAERHKPAWRMDVDFGKACPHPTGGPSVWCVNGRVAKDLYAMR